MRMPDHGGVFEFGTYEGGISESLKSGRGKAEIAPKVPEATICLVDHMAGMGMPLEGSGYVYAEIFVGKCIVNWPVEQMVWIQTLMTTDV